MDYSNLSYWVDALSLVTRLKDGSQDLKDPENIKNHSLFQDGKAGFSLRMNVLPIAMAQRSTGNTGNDQAGSREKRHEGFLCGIPDLWSHGCSLWRPQTFQELGRGGACTHCSR